MQNHWQHSSRRVGQVTDILKSSVSLITIENDVVNGHNLVVEGGMTKKVFYHEQLLIRYIYWTVWNVKEKYLYKQKIIKKR